VVGAAVVVAAVAVVGTAVVVAAVAVVGAAVVVAVVAPVVDVAVDVGPVAWTSPSACAPGTLQKPKSATTAIVAATNLLHCPVARRGVVRPRLLNPADTA
jgi:hypothetical protein